MEKFIFFALWIVIPVVEIREQARNLFKVYTEETRARSISLVL